MQIYSTERPCGSIRVILFDFDGTISTLRSGWENIMQPLMLEMIAGTAQVTDSMQKEVDDYIDASTGIQTIFQMEWLCEQVKAYGHQQSASSDPWWYKDEYNARLMRMVEQRKTAMENRTVRRDQFIIDGSERLLEALRTAGQKLFVASGTDHEDVVREAKLLGLKEYFTRIAGAPHRSAQCSKEKVLRDLLQTSGYLGKEVMVIGDGKVEIALGREIGAWTIGVASDEEKRKGINLVKQRRLENAGAHAIIGDFSDIQTIMAWMGI